MSDKLPPTEDERCGTATGHGRHRRRGERSCDPCLTAYRQYCHDWRRANRESIDAYHREWQWANRESQFEHRRAYREANREAIAERGRTYREANREAVSDLNREWRRANREEILRKSEARKARIAQAFALVAVHSGRAWTAEDEAIVRATYGQPVVMVAAQLRRLPRSVYRRRVTIRKLDRNQRKVTS